MFLKPLLPFLKYFFKYNEELYRMQVSGQLSYASEITCIGITI